MPYNFDDVGIFDGKTRAFRTVPTTGVTGTSKYCGGAAVGNVLYFGPAKMNHVGIFNTETEDFTTVAVDKGNFMSGSEDSSSYASSGLRIKNMLEIK